MVISGAGREAVIVVKPVPSLRVVVRIRLPWLRSSFAAPIVGLAAILALLAGIVAWNLQRDPIPVPDSLPDADSGLLPSGEPRVPSRIVYPYSVVPGGVATPELAAAAAAGDPVVDRHYAGFNLKRAWMVDNPELRLAHVSYRKGDRIYWTRSKVRIPPGERLLTDGVRLIRARCGNRIADIPEGDAEPHRSAVSARILDEPILDVEPGQDHVILQASGTQPQTPVPYATVDQFSLVWSSFDAGGILLPTTLAIWPAAPPVVNFEGSWTYRFEGPMITGLSFPPDGIVPPSEYRPQGDDPETPVPEPASFLLAGFGLLSGILLYRRRA